MKSLLTSRVPELHLHILVLYGQVHRVKINRQSALVLMGESVVDKPVQNIGLPHGLVSDYDYLKQIVNVFVFRHYK